MIQSRIVCDHCGADITTATAGGSFRLVLHSEQRVHETPGGFVPAVMASPPFPVTRHFCDRACLARWMECPNV